MVTFSNAHSPDSIDRLLKAGVITAAEAAVRAGIYRARLGYIPEAGYGRQNLGFDIHSLIVNRLDRSFITGDYAPILPNLNNETTSERLQAGLNPLERQQLRPIRPGVVMRENINNCPVWVSHKTLLALHSAPWGRMEQIRWAHARQTKRLMAQQASSNFIQPPLFFLPDDSAEMRAARTVKALREFDEILLILYSAHPETDEIDLRLVSPRYNDDGGLPWTWAMSLSEFDVPTPSSKASSVTQGEMSVPDAPVKLRDFPKTEEPE